MSKKPQIIKPENYRPAMDVVETDITVLAEVSDTNGQEFTYQSGPEGSGPPPHYHAWDEAFFVVRGTVEITADGITEICTPGTLAYVPGGTVHSFKYGPGGAEMLEITGAGSRAVQMFTAMSAELTERPPQLDKVAAVMGANGATVLV